MSTVKSKEAIARRPPTEHTHVLADITDAGALAAKNTVAAADIDANAVIDTKIAANAVTSGKIAASAVINSKIGAAAVTTAKLAANAVDNTILSDMAQATIRGRAASAGTGDPQDLTAAQVRTILNVEDGATADQSNAEIETAYNAQVSVVSQAEAEAGTATTVRRWTAQRVAQAIAALAGGGPMPSTSRSGGTTLGDAQLGSWQNYVGSGGHTWSFATFTKAGFISVINNGSGALTVGSASVPAGKLASVAIPASGATPIVKVES